MNLLRRQCMIHIKRITRFIPLNRFKYFSIFPDRSETAFRNIEMIDDLAKKEEEIATGSGAEQINFAFSNQTLVDYVTETYNIDRCFFNKEILGKVNTGNHYISL